MWAAANTLDRTMRFREQPSNTPEKSLGFTCPHSRPLCSRHVASGIFSRDPRTATGTRVNVCRKSQPSRGAGPREAAVLVDRHGFTLLYGQSLNPILKYCSAVKVNMIALVTCTAHKGLRPHRWQQAAAGDPAGGRGHTRRGAPPGFAKPPRGARFPFLVCFCFSSSHGFQVRPFLLLSLFVCLLL